VKEKDSGLMGVLEPSTLNQHRPKSLEVGASSVGLGAGVGSCSSQPSRH
jgi:hypothetical protein